MNAILEGKQLIQYQVSGELRILPVSHQRAATEFRFRLKNPQRIEQIKVNDKFVKVAEGTYTVQLPSTTQQQLIPLLKYTANSRWRPVPIYADAVVTSADAEGATIEATVHTNEQLKTPLQNVALSTTISTGARECAMTPGGKWDETEGQLQWRMPHLAPNQPLVCTARLSGGEGDLSQTAVDQPLFARFGCEGVTISGIELDLPPEIEPNMRLLRRFVSGKYKIDQPGTANRN